jgi:hypothetical protein
MQVGEGTNSVRLAARVLAIASATPSSTALPGSAEEVRALAALRAVAAEENAQCQKSSLVKDLSVRPERK